MGCSPIQQIWTELTDRIGEQLRVVTAYGREEYETIMRPAVREQYTSNGEHPSADNTDVRRRFLAASVESVDTSRLRAGVRVRDDAWVVVWPDGRDRKSGVIASIERTGPPRTAVETCIVYLENHATDRVRKPA